MAISTSIRLNLATFLVLLFEVSAFAQQPASPPPSPVAQSPQTSTTPTLKVKARLTVEDVTVTDAKDKPVHGLVQPDFTVKEDGKVQTIKNFEEFDSSQATNAAPAPPLPPGTYSNQQAKTPTAFNILLLDNVSTGLGVHFMFSPQDLAYSKQRAIKYLKTMPEGTEVAVLDLANGLHVVQGFTSDRDVLLAAIDSVKPEEVPGAHVPPPPFPMTQQDACNASNTQSVLTTTALAGIAGFVSGTKGRKNLIWFTHGLPWVTDYVFYSFVPCLRDYSPQLHNAYGLLAAARVAVYPVDPKGLEACVPIPPTPAMDETYISCTPESLRQNHLSLQDIANSTGGKAYHDRNDLDVAIGDAIASGSDYYSLSYVPPLAKYDGKYHTINVKVDRPDLNLLYREGYTGLDAVQPEANKKSSGNTIALSSDQPVSQFHAAMEHGPGGNDLTFYVHVQPSAAGSGSSETLKESLNPKLKGQPLTRYDLQYVIPAGEITLPDENAANPSGAEIASAQLAIAVFSPDGILLNAAGSTVVFHIKLDQAAQFLRQPSRVTVQVDLPPGKVFVRAGILDVASQKWGTLEIPDAAAAK